MFGRSSYSIKCIKNGNEIERRWKSRDQWFSDIIKVGSEVAVIVKNIKTSEWQIREIVVPFWNSYT